jgi:hypothetical protein
MENEVKLETNKIEDLHHHVVNSCRNIENMLEDLSPSRENQTSKIKKLTERIMNYVKDYN